MKTAVLALWFVDVWPTRSYATRGSLTCHLSPVGLGRLPELSPGKMGMGPLGLLVDAWKVDSFWKAPAAAIFDLQWLLPSLKPVVAILDEIKLPPTTFLSSSLIFPVRYPVKCARKKSWASVTRHPCSLSCTWLAAFFRVLYSVIAGLLPRAPGSLHALNG